MDQSVIDCLATYRAGANPDPTTERAAVKYLLGLLKDKAPGRSVEVRIPPYAAVQIVSGVRHTRGNPPATVECDGRTFLELAAGELTWTQALDTARLHASGERSDLSPLLPLVEPPNRT